MEVSPRARPATSCFRIAIGAALAVVLALTAIVIGAPPSSAASANDLVSVVDFFGQGNRRWILTSSGSVEPVGSTPHYGQGSGGGFAAAAATPSGNGYWLATLDGRIEAHGDAADLGQFTGLAPGTSIVDLAATPSGDGYWLVASDGGIFTFGDATFHGSTGALRLNAPVVAMSPTPSGRGYWLVASDGGIFTFGDAAFHGSTGDLSLNEPVVGMTPTTSGRGYYLVASDGGIFTFGDARYAGSLGSHPLRGVIGIQVIESGYVIGDDGGRLVEFVIGHPANDFGHWSAAAVSPAARIEAELYERMNEERRHRGVAPLAWDSRLVIGAREWSTHMSDFGFGHANVHHVFNTLGTYDTIGENIYRGSIEFADAGSAHLGFMASDPHRDTLLASRFTTVGIGVVCTPSGELWVTVRFGTPSGSPHTGGRPATPHHPIAVPDDGGIAC